MLETIQLWSKKAQDIVDWTVALENELDASDPEHKVIVARHEDEFHKFSPNTTDEELLKHAKAINEEKV